MHDCLKEKAIHMYQVMKGKKLRANMFGLIEECPLRCDWLAVVLHTIISK